MEDGGRSGELVGLVGIEEVAGMLGVGVRHVRRLVADRRIPYLKWGHLLRFDPVEIREWLDAGDGSHRAPVVGSDQHFYRGRYWFRTSGLCRVKAALSR